MGESSAGVNEITVNKIRGENLKPIREAFSEALSDEESSVAMNASSNGFDAENGIVGHRRNGVLNPIEVFP